MKAYGKVDYKVNPLWDICLDNADNTQILLTNDREENLLQAIAMCLKTKRKELKTSERFGSNPWDNVGRLMTPELFGEIENYLMTHLKESGVLGDGFPVRVLCAPIARDKIAIRILIVINGASRNFDTIFDLSKDRVSGTIGEVA